MVLASHLALANISLALDIDKPVGDPDDEPKTESERKARQRRAHKEYQEQRAWFLGIRDSPREYIRTVGYHDLFGLEPPEQAKPKRATRRRSREELEQELKERSMRVLSQLRVEDEAG